MQFLPKLQVFTCMQICGGEYQGFNCARKWTLFTRLHSHIHWESFCLFPRLRRCSISSTWFPIGFSLQYMGHRNFRQSKNLGSIQQNTDIARHKIEREVPLHRVGLLVLVINPLFLLYKFHLQASSRAPTLPPFPPAFHSYGWDPFDLLPVWFCNAKL